VTDESETPDRKAGLVPQKHGGAIYQGAPAHPVAGPGRPRDELRRMLRGFAWEKFPDLMAKWDKLTEDQQAKVLEIALRYGLGTQTEAVAPEDIKAEANRMLAELCRILMDEEHWPTAKVQRVVERMVEAGQKAEL